ncbi:MAG: universal stress protein [Negativicutes bacterium]
MFSKIMVPIDGSDMGWHALEHARTLGEKFNSEITVMHVVQPYNTIPSIDGSPLFIPRDIDDIQQTGQTLLKQAEEKMAGYPYPLETKIEFGYPAERILNLVKEKKYSLIVMGNRGLSGIAEFLMGGVVSRVTQHSEVPVLIVK